MLVVLTLHGFHLNENGLKSSGKTRTLTKWNKPRDGSEGVFSCAGLGIF
jgi:hypothetical protein